MQAIIEYCTRFDSSVYWFLNYDYSGLYNIMFYTPVPTKIHVNKTPQICHRIQCDISQ